MEKKGMDLVVSFDTTGSMFPVLAQVRQEAAAFVKNMFKTIDDLRVGVIAHGDYCDMDNPYTIRIMDFTTDEEKICDFIHTTKKTFGGDADECYELVMNNARKTLSWEAGRTKVFVMIGDASPHGVNYPDNKERIDWHNEAGLLNDLGVKIFAVHALSYYRDGSHRFYEEIANTTGGKYLTLDQFNEVIDLITATCLAEYNEEKLNEFVSIIRSNGRMTRTMAHNISRLSGKEYHPEFKKVQSEGLVPVNPGRFQVMTVAENCAIKQFVENNGIAFKRGRGFYELTKHETVQQYKEVIIQDRETGEMFTGEQVRERLGLQPQIEKGGVNESLSSRSTTEFRVFVQSTSFNRKLINGTAFLYEIEDLEETGTKITSTITSKKDKDEVSKKELPPITKKSTKKSSKLPPLPIDVTEVTDKEAAEKKEATKTKKTVEKKSEDAPKVTSKTLKKYNKELKEAMDEIISHSDGKSSASVLNEDIENLARITKNILKYIKK